MLRSLFLNEESVEIFNKTQTMARGNFRTLELISPGAYTRKQKLFNFG